MTTEWLYIRNVISKDDKFIFIVEDDLRKFKVIHARKSLFGTFRNRRPSVRDRVRFIVQDNTVVGFQVYKD